MNYKLCFVMIITIFLLFNCSEEDKVCNPGETKQCICKPSADLNGVQICKNTGKGWGKCDCDTNNETDNSTSDSSEHCEPILEICDGLDNDCDGEIDEDFDKDEDGYRTCDNDCNDLDSNITPESKEICNDGIDNNCDGIITCELVWEFDIGEYSPEYSSSSTIYTRSSPAIASDGTIYIGSSEGKLYAINQDGTLKWDFDTNNPIYSSPAIALDGTVYIGSGKYNEGKMYAIYPDGTLKWKFNTDSPMPASAAIGSDGTVFFSSGYTGWSDKTAIYAVGSDGIKKWEIEISDGLIASPAISNKGRIYVGRSKLYAISFDGNIQWEFEPEDDIESSPAIGDDGTIYFGSNDDKLYALNPDGTQKWSFETNDSIESSPVIGANNTVFVGSDDGKLYAINSDGTQKWSFETSEEVKSSPAIGDDGIIYFGSNDNKLYAINQDGIKKWEFETGDNIESSPTIGDDGIIYFGSYDGKLYAISTKSMGLADSTWPKYRSNNKNTGRYIGCNGTTMCGIGACTVEVDNCNNGEEQMCISTTATHEVCDDGIDNDCDGVIDCGKEKWKFVVYDWMDENESEGTIYSSPALNEDGTIYIAGMGSSDGSYTTDADGNLVDISSEKLHFYALNNGGTILWRVDLIGVKVSSPVIDSEGTIYIQSHNLYAINQDGTIKWELEIPLNNETTPSIGFDNTIFITTENKLIAINNDSTLKWEFDTGGRIGSSSSIGEGGVIYFGANHRDYETDESWNKLFAIYPDGRKKWSYEVDQIIESSPAINMEGVIFFGSGNKLFAINPNGTKRWEFENDCNIQSSPAISSDGTIYIGSVNNYEEECKKGKLLAINSVGVKKWEFETDFETDYPYIIQFSPSIGEDSVIYIEVGGYNSDNEERCGKLYAITPQGDKKWEFQNEGGYYYLNHSSPTIGHDGKIYTGSLDGTLYAVTSSSYGLENSSWPKFHRNNQNTGAIPSPECIPSQEICDHFDNNCDGTIDEGFDLDEDGYKTCDNDCDDNNITVNPSIIDDCDGIDSNCDGQIDDYCIAIDNDTGLMWQKEVSANEMSKQEAINYCDNLSFAGYNDWWLPYGRYYFVFFDYCLGDYNDSYDCSINNYCNSSMCSIIFNEHENRNYWLLNEGRFEHGYSWILSVDYNKVRFRRSIPDENNLARCIRYLECNPTTEICDGVDNDCDGRIDEAIDNNNGTVINICNPELLWQKDRSSTNLQSEEAINYCEVLNLAGYSDWRLPTDVEYKQQVLNCAHTILEYGSVDNCSCGESLICSSMFHDDYYEYGLYYWLNPESLYRHSGININSGDIESRVLDWNVFYARCVRP